MNNGIQRRKRQIKKYAGN